MSNTRRPDVRRLVSRAAIALVIVVILFVTLRPIGSVVTTSFAWCIGCSELGTLDLLYNIALFVPVGVLLGIRGANAGRALVLAAAISFGLEFLQASVVPGRDPSFSDVVANSLGAALGVPLVRAPAFIRRATPTQWGIVAGSWTVLSLAAVLLGTWVVSVPVPVTDYYVQWVPARQGYATFTGELHGLEANGIVLPAAAQIPPSRLPAGFFSAGPDVSARLTSGQRTNGIAIIARLALEYGEFMLLGRHGNAAVVRLRSEAPKVGIRSPIYALPRAFDDDPRAQLELRAIKRKHDIELRATRLGSEVPYAVRRHRITAARFWATLLPFERGFATLGVLGDILWMALLAAPASYAGARMNGGALRVLPPATQAAGLAVIAAIAQPALWWWPVWLGVVAGACAGFSIGKHGRSNGVRLHCSQ